MNKRQRGILVRDDLKRNRLRGGASIPKPHNVRQQLTRMRSELSLILAAVDDGLRRIDIEDQHKQREQAHGDSGGREHHQQGND